MTLEGGTNIGCTETSVTTNLSCVTSHKSEDLIYTAAEAWNQGNKDYCLWVSKYCLLCRCDSYNIYFYASIISEYN